MSYWPAVVLVLVLFLSTQGDAARRRRPKLRDCDESPGDVRKADAVLTGRVERTFGVDPNMAHSAEVKVKRVLRGHDVPAVVLVEGLGDSSYCNNQVRSGDVRIFVLSRLSPGRFRLNGSLERTNAHTIERTDADIQEPCERKYCPNNGDCTVDSLSGLAVCVCPGSCAREYVPVCGSDGVTYSSACQLRMDSCSHQRNAYVVHEGACHHS
ncbi:AGRN [Cordylochernes scorpioides]|uniref:AGRN n=1 Tax=Cordylochernes scorpioides TaxID=51811 RepID=A0ABY6LHZ6_9ARAC|nr:AGRN [Cordylochernes scorpioides]